MSTRQEFRVRLDWALSELKVCETTTSRKDALKAWKRVFNTDYFDIEIEESTKTSSFVITGSQPSQPVNKAGGGRFAVDSQLKPLISLL